MTVAPLREKSGLDLWISKYWLLGTLVVLALFAVIVVRHRMRDKEVALRDDSWQQLNGRLDRDPATGMHKGDPTALAALALDLKDTAAGPSARLVEAETRLQNRDYDGALTALDALAREHPNHPYAILQYKMDGESLTLVQLLRREVEAKRAFEQSHANLYGNPPLPEGAPRVRLTTDKGVILVGLYSDKAPKHVENFLKLVGEGFYNETKFHRSVPDFMIQGGDPNSKSGEPTTWGQGGPGYKVDPEPNGLFHFTGALAAAKIGGDAQSSGSQFYITTDPAHSLDGNYTIFGMLLEGQDVVERINKAPNAPNSDRPLEPVVLLTAEVL